jgi:hypothetical protein
VAAKATIAVRRNYPERADQLFSKYRHLTPCKKSAQQ